MTRTSPRTVGWIVGRAALVCGSIGLVVGLVVGLIVYAPTAWAAAFEIGIPAAIAGVAIGFGIAGIRGVARLMRQH